MRHLPVSPLGLEMRIPLEANLWHREKRGEGPWVVMRVSCVQGAGSVPVVDVVILSPPAPVVVGESVDLQILIFAHGGNSSKVLVVG